MAFKLYIAQMILKLAAPLLNKLIKSSPISRAIKRASEVLDPSIDEISAAKAIIHNHLLRFMQTELQLLDNSANLNTVNEQTLIKVPLVDFIYIPLMTCLSTDKLDYALNIRSTTAVSLRFHSLYGQIMCDVPTSLTRYFKDRFIKVMCELNPHMTPMAIAEQFEDRCAIWLFPFIQYTLTELIRQRQAH